MKVKFLILLEDTAEREQFINNFPADLERTSVPERGKDVCNSGRWKEGGNLRKGAEVSTRNPGPGSSSKFLSFLGILLVTAGVFKSKVFSALLSASSIPDVWKAAFPIWHKGSMVAKGEQQRTVAP